MAAPGAATVRPGRCSRRNTRGAGKAPPPTCRGANGRRGRGAGRPPRGGGAAAAGPARATYERHGADPRGAGHVPAPCRKRLLLPRGISGSWRAPLRCRAAGGTGGAMAGIKGARGAGGNDGRARGGAGRALGRERSGAATGPRVSQLRRGCAEPRAGTRGRSVLCAVRCPLHVAWVCSRCSADQPVLWGSGRTDVLDARMRPAPIQVPCTLFLFFYFFLRL